MKQTVSTRSASSPSQSHEHGKVSLGPLLCWAVVFADIGSSIYYVPGILYSSVGALAGFFVLLTMIVFVLLTLKYAEVSQRFPEGGGVVSVAAQAINSWAGALGGMLILVSYFLTAAISCLSAIQYFGVVVPAVLPPVLWITIGVLILLGFLNWIGISESAKVSMIGALVAFGSDLAILWTVFSHLSIADVLSLFMTSFKHETLTPTSLLIGFAGAFLAFSGLESISQLSPVMKTPRKKVIGVALLLVVLTIGVTSPLLTLLSTLLQPTQAANAELSTQLISSLGGHWGNAFLQTEVAISASLILVFASNTAIIGAYHVFMALSRMDFFPSFILKRNHLRDTPHWSIALATGIPITILLLVKGQINELGNLYAFGLLGAFTITCLGLDLIRYRERVIARLEKIQLAKMAAKNSHMAFVNAVPASLFISEEAPATNGHMPSGTNGYRTIATNGHTPSGTNEQKYISTNGQMLITANGQKSNVALSSRISLNLSTIRRIAHTAWLSVDFWLGLFTTALVSLAWVISLVSKPQAALFGGTVALIGMGIASVNYMRRGRPPLAVSQLGSRAPDSLLVLLTPGDQMNTQVIETAINSTHGKPITFLYLGEYQSDRAPQEFEIVDPYLNDVSARDAFNQAERLARAAKISRSFVYRQRKNTETFGVWKMLQPSDVILSAATAAQVSDINPDRIRYEITPNGKVAHLLKQW